MTVDDSRSIWLDRWAKAGIDDGNNGEKVANLCVLLAFNWLCTENSLKLLGRVLTREFSQLHSVRLSVRS